MEETPAWALMAAYWLHLLATVAWVGGIFTLATLVIPAARKSIHGTEYSAFLTNLSARLQQVGWFSLLVLTGTGMLQMISAPAYGGFLAIDNLWSLAILLKHLAIGLMVVGSAYVTWGLMPQMQRLALLQSAGRTVDSAEQNRLAQRESTLLRVNVVLSVVVLALTAIARAA